MTEVRDNLSRLVAKFKPWAITLTHNMADAEDLVQNAAMRALIAENTYTPGTNVDGWFARIMFNLNITRLRVRNRAFVTTGHDSFTLEGHAIDAPQELVVEAKEMRENIGKLLPGQREAAEDVLQQGMSYEEAAEKQKVSVGTIKSRLWRARLTLYRLSGEDTPEMRVERMWLAKNGFQYPEAWEGKLDADAYVRARHRGLFKELEYARFTSDDKVRYYTKTWQDMKHLRAALKGIPWKKSPSSSQKKSRSFSRVTLGGSSLS